MIDLTAKDFHQLFALNKACKREDQDEIQRIMIDYFENTRPREVWEIGQALMARVYGFEAP